eukprot:XP_001703983.1 Hypothetical protein GL50803_123348 [Giardia lamblia ATCC 50803]
MTADTSSRTLWSALACHGTLSVLATRDHHALLVLCASSLDCAVMAIPHVHRPSSSTRPRSLLLLRHSSTRAMQGLVPLQRWPHWCSLLRLHALKDRLCSLHF